MRLLRHVNVFATAAPFILAAVANGGGIVVPGGFTVVQLSPLLDGQIAELSAIDDPDFGTGVITGTVTNDVATFRLITPSGQLSTIGVWNQVPPDPQLKRVRHDAYGIVDGLIHVVIDTVGASVSHYLTIDSNGDVIERWVQAGEVGFDFDFSPGAAGNPTGAVLLDGDGTDGTQLATMDTSFLVTTQSTDSLPPGRTDTDVRGFQRDVTGIYGGGILLADSDRNHDDITAIYELRDAGSGGAYVLITAEVSTSTRYYGDLAIASTGPLGGVVYVTEQVSDEIQQVATDGTHTTWATGFSGIDSLAISIDGTSMYVADLEGIWLIREIGSQPGPVVICHEPNATGGSTLTGDAVDAFRVLFSEPVTFEDADVTITNGQGQDIVFDASGSGSQFMIIGLAESLFADTYTVTIADTVVAAGTGNALDGNDDGIAGGDAVISISHQCTHDADGDGAITISDFLSLLGAWGPCK